MRDLVSMFGIDRIVREAGLAHDPSPVSERRVQPSAFLGVHNLGSAAFAGIGLPFGRVVADDYEELASVAAANGARSLRLTPWRAILVPVPSVSDGSAIIARLSSRSFILDPNDARLRVAACSGAPSCARATAPVRDHAASLAAAIDGVPDSGIFVHVSGCEKGCAHPRPAPITLLGRNDRYDLIIDGVASDPPAMRNLTLAQVTERVGRIAASHDGSV